jgi:RNA polymerase sigma-70 factor (ECF subfamily)
MCIAREALDRHGGGHLTESLPTSVSQAAARSQALVERVRHGDRNALRALYDNHGGQVMAIAQSLLKHRQEAEDVVQETFVEVWRRAAEWDPRRGGVAAWIMTMARTRSIDRLRSRASSERTVAAAAVQPEPAHSPAPLELVEARQDRERVSAALEKLPVDQRNVIDLAYFEGLSQREISDKLQEPLGTVKTRVRLAMEKLGALLGTREGAP